MGPLRGPDLADFELGRLDQPTSCAPSGAKAARWLRHKLISPFSVLIRTEPFPAPSLKRSSMPGPYSLLRRGFGPKQFSTSPLNDSMSNSASRAPVKLIEKSPLIDSASNWPPGANPAA